LTEIVPSQDGRQSAARPHPWTRRRLLAIMSLDPTGEGRERWTKRWKTALNASA
jgi:hypothetical protein